MKKTFVIIEKELRSAFMSPVAYIVLMITISVFNIFFYLIIDQNREAVLKDVFRLMEFMFVFIIPLLTMRVFSEEKMSGTMEFLMTTPTTNTVLVIGKYLGSLVFFSFLIVLTGVYYWIIEFYAEPDRLAIVTGYCGIWLEGALFIAIGILVSSWTKNQIIAAMTAYVIIFLLYFTQAFLKYVDGASYMILRYLSTAIHLENFASGLIELTDIVYYLSGIGFCLLLTRLSIENRLWRS